MDDFRPASAPPHETQFEVHADVHYPKLSRAVSKALSESAKYPKEDGELSDSDSDSESSNQKSNKNYYDELNKQLNQIKREQELTKEEEAVIKTMNKNHSLQLEVLEENDDLLRKHLETIQKKREELQMAEEAYRELAFVEAENVIYQASKNLPRNKFTEIIKQSVRDELAQLAESQRVRQRQNAASLKPQKVKSETDDEDVQYFDTVSNLRPFSSSEDRRKKKGVKYTKKKRTQQRDNPSSSSSSSSSSESSSGPDRDRNVSKNNVNSKKKKDTKNHKKDKNNRNNDNWDRDKNNDKEESGNDKQKSDDDSLISIPSSIFDDSPYKRLVYQLKKVIDRAKNRITDCPKEKEILEITLEKIKSAQRLYYQEAPKLKNLSHHEQDYIEYLEEELEALQITVAKLINKANAEIEKRRRMPRNSLPSFNGNALEWYNYKGEILELASTIEDEKQKVVTLKRTLQGPRREEMIELLRLASNLNDCIQILDNHFGNFSSQLPHQIEIIRNLPIMPNKIPVEQESIKKILWFLRWVKSCGHDKFELSELSGVMLTKLRESTYDILLEKEGTAVETWKINKMEDILTSIQKKNILKLKSLNQDKDCLSGNYYAKSQDSAITSRYVATDGSSHQRPGRYAARPNNARQGYYTRNKNYTRNCKYCNGDHPTIKCPQILSFQNASILKSQLISKSICSKCLRRRNDIDKCDCTEKFITKYGREIYRPLCPCNSGIMEIVCPCKQRPNITTEQRQPAQDSSTVTAHSSTARRAGGQRLYNQRLLNNSIFGSSVCPMQYVTLIAPSGEKTQVLLVYDGGSQVCLCDEQLLRFSHKTEDFNYQLKQLTVTEEIKGNKLSLCFEANGKPTFIDFLSTNMDKSLSATRELMVPDAWQRDFGIDPKWRVPAGTNLLIIGRDAWEFAPIEMARLGNLSLMRSLLNNEIILAGSNNVDDFNSTPVTTDYNSYVYCQRTRVTNSQTDAGAYDSEISKNQITVKPRPCTTQKDKTFLEENSFPNVSAAICEECTKGEAMKMPDVGSQHCSKCKLLLTKSKSERFEEETLLNCLKFDGDKWTFHGVYNQFLNDLPDFRGDCIRFQTKLEHKLSRNLAICQQFNESIEKRISAGYYVEYSKLEKEYPEISQYKKVFSPLNYVLKPNSKTTSTRPVINQSFANKESNGKSFNDCQLKATSLNQPIQNILLKMREGQYQSQNDINNFYMQIHNSKRDLPLNMFFYREGGFCGNGELKAYCVTRANYGQRHSQFVANAAKFLTAEKFIKPKSKICFEQLHSLSLTDDLFFTSSDRSELKKMSAIVESGLEKGGFSLKNWIYSGVHDKSINIGNNFNIQKTSNEALKEEEIEDQDQSVGCLGLIWSTLEDLWSISAEINISAKARGKRDSKYDIETLEDAKKILQEVKITKRGLLRLAKTLYDPLNLFLQIKCNFNVLFRKIIETQPDLDWDQPIDDQFLPSLLKNIEMLLEAKTVKFPRCAVTGIEGNKCDLGIFSDGGQEGGAYRLFVRYISKTGEIKVNFLCGGTKIAKKGQKTVIKCETEACLLALKCAEKVVETLNELDFENIYLFSDSNLLLSSLVSQSCVQKMFYAERNYLSQQIIQKFKIQLFHVKSELNDSDIGSKICLDVNHCLHDYYWHSKWFWKPKNEWPTKKYEFSPTHVTTILNPRLNIKSLRLSVSTIIFENICEKFQTYNKILKTFAYIFMFSKVQNYNESEQKAKDFLLSQIQVSNKSKDGIKRQFVLHKSDKNYFFVLPRSFMKQGRIIQNKLVLVEGDTLLGRSIINESHIHCSHVGFEVAKMYSMGFYVTKNKYLFKRKQLSCHMCRIVRKERVNAVMGANRQDQARCAPPLSVINMDIVGPAKVRLTRNITKKLFILTISCLSTRYTIFVPLEDISSNSVLTGLRQASFQLATSCPKVIFCDSAQQFLALQDEKENKTDTSENLNDLRKLLLNNGIILKNSVPHSPWRNSISESMNRLLKMCLKKSNLFNKSHSLWTWNYILLKCQSTINQRCLNVSYINESFSVLTPASLLFGSRQLQDPKDLENPLKNEKLFEKIQAVDLEIKKFEQLYISSYSLEIKKWTKFQTQGRKLKQNDIVFILDRINPETKQPTLAKVVDILSDRSYSVEYSKNSAKIDPKTFQIMRGAKKYIVQRPAQQLALIASENDCQNINLEPVNLEDTEPKQHKDNLDELTEEFQVVNTDDTNQDEEDESQTEIPQAEEALPHCPNAVEVHDEFVDENQPKQIAHKTVQLKFCNKEANIEDNEAKTGGRRFEVSTSRTSKKTGQC